MLTKWLTKLLMKRAARSRLEHLLKQYGFITYCHECKAVLNGLGQWIDEVRYQYRCPCGMVSIFGFFAPVPILLSCLPDDRFPSKDVVPILPVRSTVDHGGSTNGLL